MCFEYIIWDMAMLRCTYCRVVKFLNTLSVLFLKDVTACRTVNNLFDVRARSTISCR
jgi:hypothetical protein